MRIQSLRYRHLKIEKWESLPGETWCLLGGNASGKTLLASLLTGEAKPEAGELVDVPASISLASFEKQQELYELELANDDTDFLDRIDHGSLGMEILLQSGATEDAARAIASQFGIEDILDRGYRLFSSGEARKVLLLKEALAEPELLILDEPFEGLDHDAREELGRLCQSLIEQQHTLLFLVNRIDDVIPCVTHLGLMQRGQLVAAGPKDKILALPETRQLITLDRTAIPQLPPPPSVDFPHYDTIATLKKGRVQYGDSIQFEGFDWVLEAGQHTIITGPNGAGKSTLLQLLSGDHPQCYANDLTIFGYQRGTGESIWDIKRNIGIVSAALHRDYRAPGNALTTVVSGLFDSIGLYQPASAGQRALALKWLEIMGLRDQANTFFRQLSWGQQRLTLIARGLIKQPPLLILDEPTQGLDDINRHLVLSFIETLAHLERTTLLFVSHRNDEHLSLFKNRIHFTPSPRDGVRFEATWTRA